MTPTGSSVAYHVPWVAGLQSSHAAAIILNFKVNWYFLRGKFCYMKTYVSGTVILSIRFLPVVFLSEWHTLLYTDVSIYVRTWKVYPAHIYWRFLLLLTTATALNFYAININHWW
jgi:hypothetical protein